MINYVKKYPQEKFIVATEAGILHKMQQEVPQTELISAPAHEDNTCACSECGFMKVNTMQKLYDCLLNETPQIDVPEDIRKQALLPIERMLELSK
jgi:quinolinate synthase